jgi:hypothetical protein
LGFGGIERIGGRKRREEEEHEASRVPLVVVGSYLPSFAISLTPISPFLSVLMPHCGE